MWNNYFYNIQKKYSMRLSIKEPLVIRLDGKNITKNSDISLMYKSNNSFLDAMEKTVKYFTEKYKCYAIYGSDEVSFIFINPIELMGDLDSDSDNHSNEIISLFSQYFFNYFNKFDKHRLIFWHAKCFSIPKEKLTSYLKYRSRVIENVMVTYFLKKNSSNIPNMKLEDKIEKCKLIQGYETLKKYQKGILYYEGKEIELEEIYKGNIKLIENKEKLEDMFSDLI